jgi:hypothetical protein
MLSKGARRRSIGGQEYEMVSSEDLQAQSFQQSAAPSKEIVPLDTSPYNTPDSAASYFSKRDEQDGIEIPLGFEQLNIMGGAQGMGDPMLPHPEEVKVLGAKAFPLLYVAGLPFFAILTLGAGAIGVFNYLRKKIYPPKALEELPQNEIEQLEKYWYQSYVLRQKGVSAKEQLHLLKDHGDGEITSSLIARRNEVGLGDKKYREALKAAYDREKQDGEKQKAIFARKFSWAREHGLDHQRKWYQPSRSVLFPGMFRYFFGAIEGSMVAVALSILFLSGVAPLTLTLFSCAVSVFFAGMALIDRRPRDPRAFDFTVETNKPLSWVGIFSPSRHETPLFVRGFLFPTAGSIIGIAFGPVGLALGMLAGTIVARLYPFVEHGFRKFVGAFAKSRTPKNATIKTKAELKKQAVKQLTHRRWRLPGIRFPMPVNILIGLMVGSAFGAILGGPPGYALGLAVGGGAGAFVNVLTEAFIKLFLTSKDFSPVTVAELNHSATSLDISFFKRILPGFLIGSFLLASAQVLLPAAIVTTAASIIILSIPMGLCLLTPIFSRMTGFRASVTNRFNLLNRIERKIFPWSHQNTQRNAREVDPATIQSLEFPWYLHSTYGAIVGSMTGVAIGAIVGSIIPGLGTLAGMSLGGAWGTAAGTGFFTAFVFLRNLARVISPGALYKKPKTLAENDLGAGPKLSDDIMVKAPPQFFPVMTTRSSTQTGVSLAGDAVNTFNPDAGSASNASSSIGSDGEEDSIHTQREEENFLEFDDREPVQAVSPMPRLADFRGYQPSQRGGVAGHTTRHGRGLPHSDPSHRSSVVSTSVHGFYGLQQQRARNSRRSNPTRRHLDFSGLSARPSSSGR